MKRLVTSLAIVTALALSGSTARAGSFETALVAGGAAMVTVYKAECGEIPSSAQDFARRAVKESSKADVKAAMKGEYKLIEEGGKDAYCSSTAKGLSAIGKN